MASAYRAGLRALIAERGIVRGLSVKPADIPAEFAALRLAPLPAPPLAVAVDVYGTLLASSLGEAGVGAERPGTRGGFSFPPDTADRLRAVIDEDHARSRERGIPWPEADAPSVFARALGLDREAGERACVEWECEANPCAPMPGAAAFLAACRARGLPLGIVSNAQFYTSLFLEAAFGALLFGGTAAGSQACPSLGFNRDMVFWSFESGRAKPDPWMFACLARRLGGQGIPPGRILFVGNDALNDCAAAGEAGLATALFGGDERSFNPRPADPRVAAHPPSTIVLSWSELTTFLFPQ